MEKKCCFSGYRPEKLLYLNDPRSKEFQRLQELLEEAIVESIAEGYSYFISGFARGIDLLAAEIVLKLRQTDSRLKLEAAIPGMNQTAGWAAAQQSHYYKLLDQADVRTCLHQVAGRDSFLKRNCYMVEKAQRLIAVYNGQKGGTAHTVKYAQKLKREIVTIDPDTFTVCLAERSLF